MGKKVEDRNRAVLLGLAFLQVSPGGELRRAYAGAV